MIMSNATDRANEILESAGYVIASFGLEIQEKDKRINELEAQLSNQWVSANPTADQLNSIGRKKFLAEVVYTGDAIAATTIEAVMFDKYQGWIIKDKGPLKASVKQYTKLPEPPL